MPTIGLWRWMPSIAVIKVEHGHRLFHFQYDNLSFYFGTPGVSSVTRQVPCARKAIMFAGRGPTSARAGVIYEEEVDPSDGMSLSTYQSYASGGDWHTRIGNSTSRWRRKPNTYTDRYPIFLQLGGRSGHADGRHRLLEFFFPANGKFYVMGGRERQ